jgi:hypothetical protein
MLTILTPLLHEFLIHSHIDMKAFSFQGFEYIPVLVRTGFKVFDKLATVLAGQFRLCSFLKFSMSSNEGLNPTCSSELSVFFAFFFSPNKLKMWSIMGMPLDFFDKIFAISPLFLRLLSAQSSVVAL